MHRAAWLFVRAALVLAAFAGLGALAAYLGFDYLRDADGPHISRIPIFMLHPERNP